MLGRSCVVAALLVSACAAGDEAAPPVPTQADPIVTTAAEPPAAEPAPGCAHVVDATVRLGDDGYAFDVAVASADTGWDKYADAWEVRAPDGTVLGIRELLHPHESEQPFTRSLSGVDVPAGIDRVTIAARDSVLGYCGETLTVALPPKS